MPRPKNTDQNRTRFSGFSLNPDLERDFVVGEWINEQPNAAEAIKQLIFLVATSQGLPLAGVYVGQPQAEERAPEIDPTDRRAQALLSALD